MMAASGSRRAHRAGAPSELESPDDKDITSLSTLVSVRLLSVIFNRIPASTCQRVLSDPAVLSDLKAQVNRNTDKAMQYEALSQLLDSINHQDARNAMEIVGAFTQPTTLDTQRRWYTHNDIEQRRWTDSTDIAAQSSDNSRNTSPISRKERHKRRIVKYLRNPVPDVSTSDNDDTWTRSSQNQHYRLDGHQEDVTNDAIEWERLASVNNSYTKREGASHGTVNADTDRAIPEPSSDALHKVDKADKTGVSFWVPISGNSIRKAPSSSEMISRRQRRGWPSTERMNARHTSHGVQLLERSEERGLTPSDESLRLHKASSQTWMSEEHPVSKSSFQTPRAIIRPQRAPTVWEKSLRSGIRKIDINNKGHHARSTLEEKKAGEDVGFLNLVRLPEDESVSHNGNSNQWTELNSTWYRS